MRTVNCEGGIRRQLPHLACAALSWLLLDGAVIAQEAPKNLSSYLTDVNAGTVSAGNLVGLSESAISQIQTSQDFVVALKPLTSSQSKSGFGLAITPARTSMLPVVSSFDYNNSSLSRVLANLTFSYAENSADIANISYRKSAFSLDTYLYLDAMDDPVIVAYDAFGKCKGRKAADLADSQARIKRRAAQRALDAAKTPEEREKAQDDLDAAEVVIKQAKIDAEAAHKKCVDDALKLAKWNASRLSASFGAGLIKPDDNSSSRRSLGRTTTLGGILETGKQGATYLSLRHTSQEVDLTTLGATPQYKNSTLGAARYTYGSKDDNGKWKALIEGSTAKKSDVTMTNRVFKYAVGIDAKVSKGMWLEFRLGKNRTLDGTSDQITSLMTLNVTPSSTLFAE